MGELGDLVGGNPGLVKQLDDTVFYGAAVVVRSREDFLAVNRTVRRKNDDIGEGAADIHT